MKGKGAGRKRCAGRRQIAEALQTLRPDLGYREALGLVDGVFGTIAGLLAMGERVTVANFGTFLVRRLPPDRRQLKFKAGSLLKTTVGQKS